MKTVSADLDGAVLALSRGGVIAYPTEAVYGLGCNPHDRAACEHLFRLKQRPPALGVLLIAANFEQIRRYADLTALPEPVRAKVRASWPGPQTWVLPCGADVPEWIRGKHAGIALRITAHPIAAGLCRAFGGALVSTSANRHDQAPARDAQQVIAYFGDSIDAVVEGPLGGLSQPTPIRDAISGRIIRA
ncbi:MAG: Sua5/YciO/YrdC/YwlC family protein [Rhodanobacteraceae bacterium]